MANRHVALVVEGMSCEHCRNTIREALLRLNGVYDVIVDLTVKRVAVEYDDERLDIETIRGTIEDSGYTVK